MLSSEPTGSCWRDKGAKASDSCLFEVSSKDGHTMLKNSVIKKPVIRFD